MKITFSLFGGRLASGQAERGVIVPESDDLVHHLSVLAEAVVQTALRAPQPGAHYLRWLETSEGLEGPSALQEPLLRVTWNDTEAILLAQGAPGAFRFVLRHGRFSCAVQIEYDLLWERVSSAQILTFSGHRCCAATLAERFAETLGQRLRCRGLRDPLSGGHGRGLGTSVLH